MAVPFRLNEEEKRALRLNMLELVWRFVEAYLCAILESFGLQLTPRYTNQIEFIDIIDVVTK